MKGEVFSSYDVAVEWWSTAVKVLLHVYLKRTHFLALKSVHVGYLLCSLVLTFSSNF